MAFTAKLRRLRIEAIEVLERAAVVLLPDCATEHSPTTGAS
jgi:hypothetical protein